MNENEKKRGHDILSNYLHPKEVDSATDSVINWQKGGYWKRRLERIFEYFYGEMIENIRNLFVETSPKLHQQLTPKERDNSADLFYLSKYMGSSERTLLFGAALARCSHHPL